MLEGSTSEMRILVRQEGTKNILIMGTPVKHISTYDELNLESVMRPREFERRNTLSIFLKPTVIYEESVIILASWARRGLHCED